MTTTEILRAARAKVERGWVGRCPNKDKDEDECCSLTAIKEAARTNPADRFKAYYALKKQIGLHSIVYWNDAPGRTKEEVLAAFDRAIQLSEQGP